jgi:hypothetical protein
MSIFQTLYANERAAFDAVATASRRHRRDAEIVHAAAERELDALWDGLSRGMFPSPLVTLDDWCAFQLDLSPGDKDACIAAWLRLIDRSGSRH